VSTAARADQVVWMEGGRVRRCAPHRRLWEEDPDYRAVFLADAPAPCAPLPPAGAGGETVDEAHTGADTLAGAGAHAAGRTGEEAHAGAGTRASVASASAAPPPAPTVVAQGSRATGPTTRDDPGAGE
jgi:ATP-binding cassette subfamily B protein